MHFSVQPHSEKVQQPSSVLAFSFYTCVKRISSTCNCSPAFHPCGIFSGSFISCLDSKFNSQDTGTKIGRNTKGFQWRRKWGEDGRGVGGGRRTREEILNKVRRRRDVTKSGIKQGWTHLDSKYNLFHLHYETFCSIIDSAKCLFYYLFHICVTEVKKYMWLDCLQEFDAHEMSFWI